MRIKLKAGYDEDTVAEMERNDLLNYYAEYLLSPPADQVRLRGGMAVSSAGGGMSAEEFELRLRPGTSTGDVICAVYFHVDTYFRLIEPLFCLLVFANVKIMLSTAPLPVNYC